MMRTPALTPRQQALDSLREIILAVEQFRLNLAAELGLNISDMSAMSYTRAHGPLGQKDLAHYLGFSTSSITTLVDRLEAKQLMQRRAHPHDRRRILVSLTDSGLETVNGIRDWYLSALSAIPDDDVRAAANALSTIAGELALRPGPADRRGGESGRRA
jgi:DNA-binding MarR family transcriptional regulator